MNTLANYTTIALLGYIAIMMIILLVLAIMRTGLTLKGKKAANDFAVTGEDIGPLSQRLVRAHANIYEFFPIYGGLLLLALATGHTEITNGLALVFLGARALQSLSHIWSTSIFAVQVRFFFFLVQFGIAIYWLFKFLMLAHA